MCVIIHVIRVMWSAIENNKNNTLSVEWPFKDDMQRFFTILIKSSF